MTKSFGCKNAVSSKHISVAVNITLGKKVAKESIRLAFVSTYCKVAIFLA